MLFGARMSGFGGGLVTAKKGKGKKKFEERDEEEYPEVEEEYDEELTGDGEEWDGDVPEGRYAPINTRITISKVPSHPGKADSRVPMQEP
jgi:hypothetical protein